MSMGMPTDLSDCRNDLAKADERISQLRDAVLAYAGQAPLDILSAREIQRDLRSIAGTPHRHRASIGSDQCWVCKRDLRDPIHSRETE